MLRADPRVRLTDTTWRDAHQSLLATRVRTYDLPRGAGDGPPGPRSVLAGDVGGATFDVAYRFLSEDPLGAARRAAPAGPQHHVPDAGPRRQRRRLHQLPRQRGGGVHRRGGQGRAWTCSASSTRSTTSTTCRWRSRRAQKTGRMCETAICYTGDVVDPKRTKYDLKYYVELAKEIVERARTSCASRTWPASCGRGRRRCWSRRCATRSAAAAPAHARHLGQQHRLQPGGGRGGRGGHRRRGQQHGRHDPQPSLTSMAFALQGAPRDTRCRPDFEQLAAYWEPARRTTPPSSRG